MGRQSWGLLPKVATDSSTITQDTLPNGYSQYYADAIGQQYLFYNINGSICSQRLDKTVAADLSIPNQAKGGLTYFDGTNWTGTASGTSTQFFKGGYPPVWGTPASTLSLIGSAAFAGETTKTISGLTAGGIYKFTIVLSPDGTNNANIILRFNADTGANYHYAGDFIDTVAGVTTLAAEGATSIVTTPGLAYQGTLFYMQGEFSQNTSGDKYPSLIGVVNYFRQSTANYNSGRVGGFYLNAGADLSSFSVVSDVAVTGTVTVWKFATA